jgi:hypothetical protein
VSDEDKESAERVIHPHLTSPVEGEEPMNRTRHSPPLVGGVRGGGKLMLLAKKRQDAPQVLILCYPRAGFNRIWKGSRIDRKT